MRTATLLVLVALTGCTAAQRAEHQIGTYAPYCERLGYQPDTDPWRGCIQAQAESAVATSRAISAATIQKRQTCRVVGNMAQCY